MATERARRSSASRPRPPGAASIGPRTQRVTGGCSFSRTDARRAWYPHDREAGIRLAYGEISSRRTAAALHRPRMAPATVSEMWCWPR